VKLMWRKSKLIKNFSNTPTVSGRHREKKCRVPFMVRVKSSIIEIALFSVSMIILLFNSLNGHSRQSQ